MNGKGRLKMDHGFMQSIIKNQIDRDKYDKEVKASQTTQKGSHNTSNRPRKPEIQTYVPPSTRRNQDTGEKLYLFTLQFEDQYNQLHDLDVFKEDDPGLLARQFGQEQGFSLPMVRAFTDFLKQEIRKALNKPA